MVDQRYRADCEKSWRCVSERCVTVRMKIAGVWMTVVQVYAPTDDRDNNTKEQFYASLQEVVDKAPRGDKVVVMGDLNASVGNNVARWEGVIGKQGEDVENDSGILLLSFSAENGFKVLNTFYEHKEIHKYTWKCPGRGLKLIIDYFLVRNEMKRNVNNVAVVRGAEIGSDHHLVLMKVRLHRRVHARKVEERSRLSTERLATKEGKMAYQIRLRLKLNGAK